MQFLYDSRRRRASSWTRSDYEQIDDPARRSLGDALRWVLPNDEVDVLFVDERPADVQVPSAVELTVTETEPGRARATPPRAAAPSRRRSSPASSVQVPLFVERGRPGPGRHAHAASTSRAPERRASPMRRTDQRRAAVFALYQREVTGRPLDDAARARRRAVHARAGRGRRGRTARSSTRAIARHAQRLGRSTGSRRSSAASCASRCYEMLHRPRRTIPAEVRDRRGGRDRQGATAAPRRRGSSTASSARRCASGRQPTDERGR